MEPKKKNHQWIAAEEEIERQLLSGERLLWAGPCVRATLRRYEWVNIAVLVVPLLMMVALFLSIPEPPSSFIMLILFWGIMILISASNPVLNWWVRKHAFYALTDQRGLVQSNTVRGKFSVSIPPENVHQIELVDHGDGVGDIILGYEKHGSFPVSVRVPYGLFGIENAHEVAALVMGSFGLHHNH